MKNPNLIAFQMLNAEMNNEYYQNLDKPIRFTLFQLAEFINDTIQYADDSTLVESLFPMWDLYWDEVYTQYIIDNGLDAKKRRFEELLIDDPQNVLISGYFKVMFFLLLVERNKLNTH